ncbi:hypothetical protein AA700_0368 [Acidiphilium acidophilum DSM 700]|nr:hypothetical protein AA700_0368 [Acidiphilium acidophilum DSM 700]
MLGGPTSCSRQRLIHYAKGLSYQLAAKGIRVNVLWRGNAYFESGVGEKIARGNPDRST